MWDRDGTMVGRPLIGGTIFVWIHAYLFGQKEAGVWTTGLTNVRAACARGVPTAWFLLLHT